MVNDINQIVISLIEDESENTHLDFKRDQYPIEKGSPKKSEFLKDMCAFANVQSARDKYIIIGVTGMSSDKEFFPIEQLIDQSKYQQYLNEYIEPEIKFEYREISYKGYRLAFFRLFNNNDYPYLFKKELKESPPKGTHYRIGTGFIKSGSSTRGLKRDDFEKIYKARFGVQDRSNDIDFTLLIEDFQDSDLTDAGYMHLKIDAINKSNKSIDLDVTAKIYHKPGLKVECAQDVEHEMATKIRDNSMFAYTPYLDTVHPKFAYLDMNVDYTRHTAFTNFELTPPKGAQTALRIMQNAQVRDIFNGQIALKFFELTELQIEIAARSDDFPEGPKVFNYVFSDKVVASFLSKYNA